MSQYTQINKIKYEKDLLQYAKDATTIQKNDVTVLWALARDGHVITDTETRSLNYIKDNFKMTDGAKDLLSKLLRSHAQTVHSESKK